MNVKDAKPGMRVIHTNGSKGTILAVYQKIKVSNIYVDWDHCPASKTPAVNCEILPEFPFKVGDRVFHKLIQQSGTVKRIHNFTSVDDMEVEWDSGKTSWCASGNCNCEVDWTVCIKPKKETNMLTQKLKTGVFIVGSLDKNTGDFCVSANPAEHSTLKHAQNEAERLALQFTNKDYVVLEVKGTVSRSNFVWR